MFTGIIENIGTVAAFDGPDLTLRAPMIRAGLALGDSVAVDGVCLTVAELTGDGFTVQVSPETFARTTLGALRVGRPVSLERAMQAGARFGGHFVLGHVDAVGRIAETRPLDGGFALWRFAAPPEVARFLVPKGSVAIDGVSLTVVEPKDGAFSVALIPVTLRDTALGKKSAGDAVNLEADMIAKHIRHFMDQDAGGRGGISREFLAGHGFA